MFATSIWAVCANLRGVGANLAVVLLSASANRCWSLGLMFGDWLMLWLKLTILFSKAHSIFTYIMLFTSQTMLGKAKRLIESFWVKSSNWSKLKHRMTIRSEAAVGKSVRSGKICANVNCANVWRHRQKKSVRLTADEQSWIVRYFSGLITCIEQAAQSTFTNRFESKRSCWTLISNREL